MFRSPSLRAVVKVHRIADAFVGPARWALLRIPAQKHSGSLLFLSRSGGTGVGERVEAQEGRVEGLGIKDQTAQVHNGDRGRK